MKLEKQICSLEHAKKLKELGVKQESEWIWAIMNIGAGQSAYIYNTVGDKGYHRDVEYSAFTVAELGEMITKYGKHGNDLPKWDYGWQCPQFMNILHNAENIEGQWDLTEANARAKMLIYLIENKLLEDKI